MPMEEKRRTKRSSKVLDEGRWDCSVCTYSNSQEAFKCEMCDVRKGTSTRKPKLNPSLVAQQVSPQYTQPPPKKEKSISQNSKGERRKSDASVASSVPSPSPSVSTSPPSPQSSSSRDATSLTATTSSHSNPSTPTTTAPFTDKHEKPEKPNRKNRPPRLKNIDRSSATSMEVTVGNVTVIITDYKPKKEKERRTSVDTSHNGTSALHNPPPPAPQSDSLKTENDDTNAVSIKNETLATNGDIPKEEEAS